MRYLDAVLSAGRPHGANVGPVAIESGTPPAPGASGSFGWRVRASFGVRGLTTRLENDLDILMGGCRREIPRHQSLKSTFDWSYALLGETERRVLRRLAVFDGVFAQRSASTLLGDIHADDSEIVDILAQLVTKCLVVALDVGGSEPSYRLLNTTRAYARKKLIEAESDLILRCRDEELSVIPALYFQADTA